MLELVHDSLEEACRHHEHVAVFTQNRVGQHGHILADHFVVNEHGQLTYEVELALDAMLFLTVFVLTALVVLATGAPFVLTFFPEDFPLGFDGQNFAFAELLKHLDQQVVQKHCILQQFK